MSFYRIFSCFNLAYIIITMASRNINNISTELMDKIKSIACDVFTINKNEFLFKEGERTDYLYFIENGDVILKKQKNNQTITFHELMSGELLGLDCVYNDGFCNYTAKAKETTTGIKILISDFINMIAKHQKSSLELMKYLSSLVNKLETRF